MSNTKADEKYTTQQECLNDLIGHKLVTFEDNVKTLRRGAFSHNTTLKHLILPNVTSINYNNNLNVNDTAFYSCTNLEDVDFGVFSDFRWYASYYLFNQCPNLAHLILRSSTKCTYYNGYNNNLASWTDILKGTAIHYKNGAIYVPENLLESYQTDDVWGQFFIVPIQDHLLTTFDTITDDWATIVRKCNTGLIDDYKIGDSKAFHDINGNTFYAELVGKNTDTVTTTNRKAPTTWITRELYPDSRRFNQNNDSAWANCDIRTWLNNEDIGIFSIIDENALRNNIKAVTKISWNGSSEITTSDKLWIPSIREILGLSDYESSGPDYSNFFLQHRFKRIKYVTLQGYQNLTKGTTYSYWTRTSSNSNSSILRGISTSGAITDLSRTGQYPYCFGFCI